LLKEQLVDMKELLKRNTATRASTINGQEMSLFEITPFEEDTGQKEIQPLDLEKIRSMADVAPK